MTCRPRTPRKHSRCCGRRTPGADSRGPRSLSHARRRRSRTALYPQGSRRPPGLPCHLRRRPGPAQLRLRAWLQLPRHPQPAAHRTPCPTPRRHCGLLVRGEPAGESRVPHSLPHTRVLLILFSLRLWGVGWRDRGPWSLVASSSARPGPQAVVTLGAAAGGVLGGWLLDRAGRKLSLLLCTVPFVTGFAVITAARDVWMLLGGRLLTGLACGVASLVAPVSGLGFLDDLRQAGSAGQE